VCVCDTVGVWMRVYASPLSAWIQATGFRTYKIIIKIILSRQGHNNFVYSGITA